MPISYSSAQAALLVLTSSQLLATRVVEVIMVILLNTDMYQHLFRTKEVVYECL